MPASITKVRQAIAVADIATELVVEFDEHEAYRWETFAELNALHRERARLTREANRAAERFTRVSGGVEYVYGLRV